MTDRKAMVDYENQLVQDNIIKIHRQLKTVEYWLSHPEIKPYIKSLLLRSKEDLILDIEDELRCLPPIVMH